MFKFDSTRSDWKASSCLHQSEANIINDMAKEYVTDKENWTDELRADRRPGMQAIRNREILCTLMTRHLSSSELNGDDHYTITDIVESSMFVQNVLRAIQQHLTFNRIS